MIIYVCLRLRCILLRTAFGVADLENHRMVEPTLEKYTSIYHMSRLLVLDISKHVAHHAIHSG